MDCPAGPARPGSGSPGSAGCPAAWPAGWTVPAWALKFVVAAKMVTVPDVPVASMLSVSHLPMGAKVVPVFWEKGGGPFGRRTKFGETN